MKKFKYEIVYYVLLVAFSAYVLLDTFFIPREYSDANKVTKGQFASIDSSSIISLSVADEILYEYDNGNTQIIISTKRAYDSTIYIAEIITNSAECIKTGLAKGAYGKNVKEKTSETAAANNAVLAINGDYYGVRETGYVIKNGVLYRSEPDETKEDLVILSDGSFFIAKETEYTAEQLLAMGAWQTLSFGPSIVQNSEVSSSIDRQGNQANIDNPRTAIGIVEKGHYFFVVNDGRTEESIGMTLLELADFMVQLGCTTAYNLDGGGSSTFYFDGKVLNKPTTNGSTFKERKVSDIVYIGY